jgi:tetratricopeptide (TPR) repeat protein
MVAALALTVVLPAFSQDSIEEAHRALRQLKERIPPAASPLQALSQDSLEEAQRALRQLTEQIPAAQSELLRGLQELDGIQGGIPGGVLATVPGGVFGPHPGMPPGALFGLHPGMPAGAGPMFLAQRAARSGDDDRLYERGQDALDKHNWDRALENFSEVAARGGSRADGALYWKAYSLAKLGRRDEALAALDQLRKSNAGSRWLDDAKALDMEVRQASGQKVKPESESDEELKLMAINSLLSSDPDRAVPMLEQLLKSGNQSPKLKDRALFVLTQSGSAKAREIVVQMAKGGANPDLQMKAVRYLGVMGDRKDLGEVYAASSDLAVKRAVLHSLMASGAREQLLNAAKSEKNAELRKEAIHQLGAIGSQAELWQLYQSETAPEIRQEIIHGLFIGGNTEKLLEVARTDKDPALRREAIHRLGAMDVRRTGDTLAAMYTSDSDPAVKKEIVRALFIQGNARALVEIARKEKDMEMKKEIVRNLSHMRSKEATDYMMELLK